MSESPRYTEFGFPLANLPLPGHDMTTLDMLNTVQPLLEGTYAIVMALNVAFVKNIVTIEEGSDALSLLEGHLETALKILKRWWECERGKRLGQEPAHDMSEEGDGHGYL